MTDSGRVTKLLQDLSGGDRAAFDELVPLVYERLRKIAHRQLRGERAGHTLSTTALVHESFLDLAELERMSYRDRTHFFGVAAGTMRRVLVDYAVRRKAAKRGGGRQPVTLDDAPSGGELTLEDVLSLDEALTRLEGAQPRHARIVECRFFGGLTVEETASVLDVSPATVKRDWAFARAFLNRELAGAAPSPAV